MANEVRITIGADTKEADKAVKSFKDKLKDISGKAKGAGLALGAMGAGGVVAIKGFANAALVQEKAVAALTATMANAGESFSDVEDKVMSTTAALQKKTNFGDEAQIAALSQLIPVLGSTELALAALPAVMDVAALQGTDLLSTVKTMGPALGGLTNRVRGTALEFDAADDPMTRINKVLDQLGGTAESQADPFTQMGNAIGDVKESIGMQLLPLITPLIAGLQSFAEWLQTLNPQVVKIAALVLAGATAFGLIGGPILLLIGFLPMLSVGFTILSASMGPITLVILGIAAAITAGIVIWKNWDKILDKIKSTIKGVIDWVKKLGKAIADSAIGKFVGGIGGLAGKLPFMAGGGMIGGPEGAAQLAVVHGGERVLTRSQQAGLGLNNSNTFNITVNGNVDDPEEMARLIAEQVNTIMGEASIHNEATRSR